MTLLVALWVKFEALAAVAPGATTGTKLAGTRFRLGITGGVTVFLVLLSVVLLEVLPEPVLPELLPFELVPLELVPPELVPPEVPLVLPEVVPLELPLEPPLLALPLRFTVLVVTPLLNVPAAAPPETVPFTATFWALMYV